MFQSSPEDLTQYKAEERYPLYPIGAIRLKFIPEQVNYKSYIRNLFTKDLSFKVPIIVLSNSRKKYDLFFNILLIDLRVINVF